MIDRSDSVKAPTSISTSAVSASSQPVGSSNIRPRNRRLDNAVQSDGTPASIHSTRSSAGLCPSRDVMRSSTDVAGSSERLGLGTRPDNAAGGHELARFLGDSWTRSWTSVQAFASNIMPNGNKPSNGLRPPQGRLRLRSNSRLDTWGPVPPSRLPSTHVSAAGSLARREADLKVAKTASVLESYEGVNGGLDISGKHKRRKSDELTSHDLQAAEQLVYVHEVQPNDTYAGIVLRYKCREDVFRKANRLWSRDSIQTRKLLILPVDACEIRGRPCGSPTGDQGYETDFLAPTPSAIGGAPSTNETHSDSFFAELHSSASNANTHCEQDAEDDRPWTHVRWVQIETFEKPVQIARVARQSLGYFPPRRKRSVRTVSPLSTPRQSSDLFNLPPSSNERPSHHRIDSSSDQPPVSGTPVSSCSRAGSETADTRPTWMRRPGGVGSMNSNVRAPGPDKDYLNIWAKKHLPGLNIDELPSMSVMGSESAHFGFGHSSPSIVEGPLEEGRDISSTSRQGNGLDRAAAVVEHWLRGALAKRPSTPLLGNRSRPTGSSSNQAVSDLIELMDATGEEDKPTNLLTPSRPVATARNDDIVSLRGKKRMAVGNPDTQKKDD